MEGRRAVLAMADRRESEAESLPAARAWVRRIALTRFRCYARAELEADSRPVVLTGPNGAGKTNLLEALSYLAPGRGLRGARLSAVDRRPAGSEVAAGPWAVAARIVSPAGEIAIGTGREPLPGEEAKERRALRIDGAPAKGQAVLAELLAVIWLTPQMDRLLQEGASGRRRFLDRLVFAFDPAHAARVSAYEHAWRQRQRLIEEQGAAADRSWLGALEDRLAESGVAIAAARQELVRRLHAAAAVPGPFPRPELRLDGVVESWLEDAPALAAEERLRAALAAARSPAGPPAPGPHRSDLKLVHGQKGVPAEEASTGEQKALLVALVLAHARLMAAERGAAPVLLLDEVVAHLDEERRSHLFEALVQLGAQAWMTGTDEALFLPLGCAAQFFRIKDAAISAGSDR
ncbi:MAG TPA: DNA replication/repair protein RecF [Methylomirabilota bacterium]|nr:DNA replication/repair protein RecF [Methylomirabilota bacterium]